MSAPRGYDFDAVIVSQLVEDCPAVERLLQEMSAAQDRRDAAALLAGFDLTQIPRRCLGAFERHCTTLLNELPD